VPPRAIDRPRAAPEVQAGAVAPAARAVVPPAPGPRFDVVRISPDGRTVIAGRARPNDTVVVLSGETELGRVRANGAGEWVFVPDAPLASGAHELGLRAEQPGREAQESDKVVVAVVPEAKPGAAAATPAMAIATPREGRGSSVVLQAPPAAPAVPAPPASAPPVSTPAVPASAAAAPTVAAAPQPAAPTPPAPVAAAPSAPRPPATQAAPPAPAAAQGSVSQPVPPPAAAPATPAPQQQAAVPPLVRPAPAAAPAPVAPAAGAPTTRIDAVDYDDAGTVSMSGRAQPGSTVQLYVDNQPIGRGTADDRGVWTVTPETPVAPGTYVLRADQVTPEGRVTGRAESPFQRAEPESAAAAVAAGGGTIIVQPGANLWRIARASYGQGVRYTVIYRANRDQIRDPHWIYPGQIFQIPQAN